MTKKCRGRWAVPVGYDVKAVRRWEVRKGRAVIYRGEHKTTAVAVAVNHARREPEAVVRLWTQQGGLQAVRRYERSRPGS